MPSTLGIYIISKKLDEMIINQLIKNFPSQNINIVTPKNEIQMALKNIYFIDENTILNKKIIQEKLKPIGNIGWYYQQFLKYKVVLSAPEEHVHIIDGDSITLKEWSKPGILATTGKSSHIKYTYFSMLTIGFTCQHFSFVTNQMVFCKSVLSEMLLNIETLNNNKDWIDSFIEIMIKNPHAVFSEYQLYGDYLYNKKGTNPELIKVFRRMDCISQSPDRALKKYGLIAYEPHHETGLLRFLRAQIFYRLGIALG